jgi:hypothetical protein
MTRSKDQVAEPADCHVVCDCASVVFGDVL